MMYPSLRGGVDNPGAREGFFGEVDDVLAAADYLAQQDFVDPRRIYLGGHSTGGTLALLAAASTDRFRAVFSFGPIADVAGYGAEVLPFDAASKRERDLRAPVLWMHSIQCPTFVLEGTGQPGNVDSLRALDRASGNPLVRFYQVKGANHFSILAPTTKLIADKILRDVGPTTDIAISEDELKASLGR
jgi:dienelactone hydrolase